VSSSRLLIPIILALLVFWAGWPALHREPWDPDETRYLQVTQELMDSRNPLVLTFNRQPYADKPPLFFWLLTLPVAVFGSDSALAGIVPSLAALLALAGVTRRLGEHAGLEPEAAQWGAILTVTTLLPATLGGGCRMDLVFTLLCALALDRLVALAGDEPRGSKDHLLLWLWIALGVLTKGPLAIALPLLAAVALAAFDARPLRRAVAGWGPLLALLLVGAWLVPAALLAGGTWFETIAIHQTTGRLVSSFAHREPWWYHLATVPLTMLPWSPAALLAGVVAFTQPHALPGRARVLAIYPITTLGLLSLLSGKMLLYPLPLFPAACTVAAWWLVRRPLGPAQRTATAVGGVILCCVGTALALMATRRPDVALSPVTASLLGLSLAVPGGLALVGALTRRQVWAAGSLALGVPIFVAVGLQTLVPSFDRLLSLRPFARALTEVEGDIELPGLAYGKIQPGFVLFTGRAFELIDRPDKLHHALDAGRVVAINVKAANRLTREGVGGWHSVAEVPYRHTKILLIAADEPRPMPTPASHSVQTLPARPP